MSRSLKAQQPRPWSHLNSIHGPKNKKNGPLFRENHQPGSHTHGGLYSRFCYDLYSSISKPVFRPIFLKSKDTGRNSSISHSSSSSSYTKLHDHTLDRDF
jgi:hypothetical protein